MTPNPRGFGGGRWLKILGIIYLIRLFQRHRRQRQQPESDWQIPVAASIPT
jgi:hypothetical protein